MGKRILLADDSVTIQKVVELTFMDEDYEVVAVSNGDDALVELDKELPDLVIADVHMPGANGYELCRQAKEAAPGLPVLLLVGTFEPFDEAEAQGAGADGHLKKPFDSQELLRRVEELLAAAEAAAADEDELDEAEEADEIVEAIPVEGLEAAEEDEPEAIEEPAPEDEDDLEAVGDLPDLDGIEDVEVAADEELYEEPYEEPYEESDDEPVQAADAEEPVEEPESVAAFEPEAAEPAVVVDGGATNGLSAEDVDRIARRVVELIGDQVLREVAWDVVPDLAELVIKDRIRELEQQLE